MKAHTVEGKFITVEGIEGLGKSTNVQYIQDYLAKKNISSIITREPGGTAMAESLRGLLLEPREEPMSAETEALILFAARAQHLEQVIKPALISGEWVICDRFTDATYAYQGYGGELAIDQIALLETFVQKELRPDLTIVLDASVSIAFERVKARRQGVDRMEQKSLNYFEKVRQGYLTLAEKFPERIKVVNANQSLEDVQHSIDAVLQAFLVLEYDE